MLSGNLLSGSKKFKTLGLFLIVFSTMLLAGIFILIFTK